MIRGNPIRQLSRSATDRDVVEGSALERTPASAAHPIAARSGLLRVAPWLVIGAAAALPLVVSPATADAFFLPKLVAARLVVIALVLVLGVAAVRGRLRIRRTPLDLPLAIFVVSALVSTLLATNRNLSIFGAYGRYEGFLTVLLYALLFWLSAQALDGPKDATLVVRTLLGAAFIASILTIGQVALGSLSGGGAAETGFSFAGFLRGYATFGNPNALAGFLAMLLPLAVWELLAARSLSGRLLATNAIVVMSLGLLLTFSRTSWAGAALGVLVVLVIATPPRLRFALIVAALAILVVIGGSGRLRPPATSPTVIGAAAARVDSLQAPLSPGSTGQFRLYVWEDSLRLIASRPLNGYGPDSFGLVYPRFQTGNWAPGAIIDRPHNELLGIAANQGLLGLGASGLIVLAIARAFWKRRRELQSVALFGGFIAYAIYLFFNFSYLPVTLPFWILAAAAITVWCPAQRLAIPGPRRLPTRTVVGAMIALAAVAIVPLIIAPYAADVTYGRGRDAMAAGQRQEARDLVDRARELAPWQSTYAAAAGSLALDLDGRGQPGANADWSAARTDFTSAAQLGAASATVYRYLAMSDAALGDQADAVAAARTAAQLDRYDPANQAELTRLTRPSSR